jgi:predicted alpha/beta hydrolase
MKIVGILVLGVVSGLLAAAASIGWGGTFWEALANYFLVGMAATMFGLVVVILRAWDGEMPSSKQMIGPGASASK